MNVKDIQDMVGILRFLEEFYFPPDTVPPSLITAGKERACGTQSQRRTLRRQKY